MFRLLMMTAIVVLVGVGFTLASSGGIYLAVIAVVLAYVRGRMDEEDRKARRRGGYLSVTGEHPYRQSTLTEFEQARPGGRSA